MSKHSPKHPVGPPRLFANTYQLSRQLPYQGQGDLWLGEKNDQSYWIYYFPLATNQANQLWEKWRLNWETQKREARNKALVLPEEIQKENEFAVIVFPAPFGENISQEQKKLSEIELALLMLDISQSLIEARTSYDQLTISPQYMYRRAEGGFAIFGWGLGYLNKSLSGQKNFGSSAYLAPENFDDALNIGPQSAIFSLGVSLYELAGGVLPFGMKGGARLAQVNAPLPELPQYSERFNHILQLMLARKADRRPSADTLYRLANTFIKEQQWKSVGGLSFAPSLSGTPLNIQEKLVNQSLERPVATEQPKRSPKEVAVSKTSGNKNLWYLLIPLIAIISFAAWFALKPEPVERPKVAQTNSQKFADELNQLINSRQYFEELVTSMAENPNLPPTEKTFLRLAQMQLKNLEMEIEEQLLVGDDNAISWKDDIDLNWLNNTQSQLDRNIQNLELLR